MKRRWWLIGAVFLALEAPGKVHDSAERGEITYALITGAPLLALGPAYLAAKFRELMRWCVTRLRGRWLAPDESGMETAVRPGEMVTGTGKVTRFVVPIMVGGAIAIAVIVTKLAPSAWRADLLMAVLVGMGVLAGLVLPDDE